MREIDEKFRSDWCSDRLRGKAVQHVFVGTDELGYPFMQVQFEDGTELRATGDGMSVADVIVEVSDD